MFLIAHRGNVFGPCPKDENKPSYILKALGMGFDCEIDVWLIEGKFYLGHDGPQYQTDFDFFIKNKDKLWIHCKNLDALVYILEKKLNCFFHDKDHYTITANGFIWGNINSPIHCKMICVMPEKYAVSPSHEELMNCQGVCSDFVYKLKSL